MTTPDPLAVARARLRSLDRLMQMALNHEDVDLPHGMGYERRFLERLIKEYEKVKLPTPDDAMRLSFEAARALTATNLPMRGRPLVAWEVDEWTRLRDAAKKLDHADGLALAEKALREGAEFAEDAHVSLLVDVRAGRYDNYLIYGEGVAPIGNFDDAKRADRINFACKARLAELKVRVDEARARLLAERAEHTTNRERFVDIERKLVWMDKPLTHRTGR